MNRDGFHQEKITGHTTAVCRALRRLGRDRDYCFLDAERNAEGRMSGGNYSDPELMALAVSKLCEEQWSPEQISTRSN